MSAKKYKHGGGSVFGDLGSVPVASFRPNAGRILVRRCDQPERYGGRIILLAKPDDERRFEVTEGVVAAVGPPVVDDVGRERRPLVGVGARVYLSKFCGHDLMFAEGAYVLVTEEEVLFEREPSCGPQLEPEAAAA